MKTYPIILIPSALKSARFALPPAPVFNEEPPIWPGPKPQRLEKGVMKNRFRDLFNIVLFFFVSGIILILLGASSTTEVFGIIFTIILIGGMILGLQIVEDKFFYQTYYQQWQLQVKEYPRLEELYLQRKKEHQEEVKKIRTAAKVAEFRLNAIQEVLKQIHVYSHDGINTSAKQGPCEEILKAHLSQYFPGEIHSCLTLKIPDYKYPYTTDCAYINSSSKIFIDIEIDEPYVHSSKEPYHQINSWTDERRNEFFLERNWIVIRFAEEQVARWPLSCCKVVATVIKKLTGIPIPPTLASQPTLTTVNRWTHKDAEEMAENNFRDTYLRQINKTSYVPKNSTPVESPPQPFTYSTQQPEKIASVLERLNKLKSERAALQSSLPSVQSRSTPPNTNLAPCPYCKVLVRRTKLATHKSSKCPKRPGLGK